MSGQTIECPCGTVLRGTDEEAVIAEARAHAKAVHDMDLSEDEARSMARPA
jgi:predicted small metal-binding protein